MIEGAQSFSGAANRYSSLQEDGGDAAEAELQDEAECNDAGADRDDEQSDAFDSLWVGFENTQVS